MWTIRKNVRLALVFSALLVCSSTSSTHAADHRDGSIQQDQPADIADTYAFVNPKNGNVVLGFTVNPYTVPGVAASFSTDILHQIKIDNTGDFREDWVIQFAFDGFVPQQTATVIGPARPRHVGPVNFMLSDRFKRRGSAQVFETAADGEVRTAPDGMKVFAGRVDDPFFIDLIFVRSLFGIVPPLTRAPGRDLFAGLNVSLVLVELPTSRLLGSSRDTLRVWSTTSRRRLTVRDDDDPNRELGAWVQVDRQGLPAVNALLVPGTRRDEFNRSGPDGDDRFVADTAALIETLNGGDSAAAREIADFLYPDVLTLDTSSTEDFPNGRRPDSDFVDVFLPLLSSGAVAGDGVDGNDVHFLEDFPFFPPEHLPSEAIPARD